MKVTFGIKNVVKQLNGGSNIHQHCAQNIRLCQSVHFNANMIIIGCKIKKKLIAIE